MFRVALFALLLLPLAACTDDDPAPVPVADEVTFEFRTRGYGPEETFHARTADVVVIAQVRAQLALPADERFLFPIGDIAVGDGGYNAPWGWHYTDFALAELAIELCDGIPSMIDPELDYWVNTVGNYCPWGGYVWAELPPE